MNDYMYETYRTANSRYPADYSSNNPAPSVSSEGSLNPTECTTNKRPDGTTDSYTCCSGDQCTTHKAYNPNEVSTTTKFWNFFGVHWD